ncbi:High-affinity zinc uptake system protein znuA precursor [Streptococcus suis 98HAH33]|nr:High-affinity zinc uptake system protein znuA precursor [Streptococcus suis 98HAH33]
MSTDSEVANSDMIETVNLIIDHNIKAIFTESTTNPERMKKLQEAVKAKGGQVEVVTGEGKELFSDSLAPEGEEGDTFIDMYKHNVKLMVKYLK